MKRHAFSLAVTATITALVLSGCGDDEPDGNADDPASTPPSESSEPTPTDATTSPSEPTTTEPSTAPAETVSVPVFFVADTPQGPRLFAEQREVQSDNPTAETLALLMAGDVLDADYRTLVPAGSVAVDPAFEEVEDEGVYSLSLTSDAWTERPDGMSRAEADLAVQQIVYTLLSQDAADGADRLDGGVVFKLDDAEVSFLGVDGPAEAADELDVRGLVNILQPVDGATVSGSFEASGEASSFEATVPWQIQDESGAAVLEGFSTAEGYIDGLYPWAATVDVSGLAPGEYTFVAMTDDPSGGEGPGPTEDSKTIVVE